MSDAEDIAAAAAEEAIAETEEERDRKRKERLEQNRLSARESRKRKKAMIEELQRTVITLSRDNKELNDKNEQLRRQLLDIGTKVRTAMLSKARGRRCDGLIRLHHFQNTADKAPTSPSFRGTSGTITIDAEEGGLQRHGVSDFKWGFVCLNSSTVVWRGE